MSDSDFFLKIDGISGEAKAKGVEEWIHIHSFSFGVVNMGTGGMGGGSGAGRASFQDLSISKDVDKSTPALWLACATGKHIPSAELRCRKSGGGMQEYYTIKLTDVMISSANAGGSGTIPSENVSINFSKIETIYKEQDEKGPTGKQVGFKFDVKANAGS